MSRVPQTEKAFALVGLGPEVAGAGLQLQVSSPDYKTRDGKRVVIIKGFVVNISQRARVVPEMIVKVYDKNKNVLYEKRFAPSSPELLIRESISFATDLIDPPAAGTGIEVTFDPARPDKPAADHP
jgi:hypothetical protein